MINLHAIQSQNSSKFTGNISKNTSKLTSKTNQIRSSEEEAQEPAGPAHSTPPTTRRWPSPTPPATRRWRLGSLQPRKLRRGGRRRPEEVVRGERHRARRPSSSSTSGARPVGLCCLTGSALASARTHAMHLLESYEGLARMPSVRQSFSLSFSLRSLSLSIHFWEYAAT